MKLLIFSPHYPPYIGGLETHAAEFNKYISEDPIIEAITVFTAHIPTHTLQVEKQKKITIIRFPAFHIIPNYPVPKLWLPQFWRQWRTIQRYNADLILSRTRFCFASLLALILAKSQRKPWIHIEHGSDYVQLANPFFAWVAYLYDQTIGRLIFRSSTKNIAISQAVKTFVSQFDARPIPVIYRGVEIDFIENVTPDEKLRQRLKGKVGVIFVGRLIDGKGVTDLLYALADLKNDEVRGLIVGEGSQRTNLESLTRTLGIEDKVEFFGQQPLKQALALVKAADIFVNPSYTEGLPSSVIEAALCRLAIIATDVGGTREIIEHNKSGYLIPARDRVSLAHYLRVIINHPEDSKKIGVEAYRAANERFAWSKSCDTYKEIFKEILGLHS